METSRVKGEGTLILAEGGFVALANDNGDEEMVVNDQVDEDDGGASRHNVNSILFW